MGARTKRRRIQDEKAQVEVMKNRHVGSSFDSFLEEEGLETEVAAKAAKRTFVHRLEAKMVRAHKKKTDFRKALGSPTTADRVFSDHTGTSLLTMARAAEVVDCDIEVRLVSRHAKQPKMSKGVAIHSHHRIAAKGR